MQCCCASVATCETQSVFEELAARLGAVRYIGHADRGRTLVDVRGSCERLTGYSAEDFIEGRASFGDLIHPDDAGAVRAELGLALIEGRDFELAYRIIDARGELRWVWEVGSVVQANETGIAPLRGFMFDTTGAPQTRTLALSEGVVSAVAHDLKNLLAVMLSGSDLLESLVGADHPAQRTAAQIREVVGSAGRLVEHLARSVRPRRPSAVPTDLREVLERTQFVLRALVGEDVVLEVTATPNLKLARATSTQVERIVLNLADNARRAMPQGGRLTISTRRARVTNELLVTSGPLPAGEYAVLSVSDTGAGMTEGVLHRAFERGFTTQGRSGLGLATVRQLTKECGGAVAVSSSVGTGTTFEVYLPLCDGGGVMPSSLVRRR